MMQKTTLGDLKAARAEAVTAISRVGDPLWRRAVHALLEDIDAETPEHSYFPVIERELARRWNYDGLDPAARAAVYTFVAGQDKPTVTRTPLDVQAAYRSGPGASQVRPMGVLGSQLG